MAAFLRSVYLLYGPQQMESTAVIGFVQLYNDYLAFHRIPEWIDENILNLIRKQFY